MAFGFACPNALLVYVVTSTGSTGSESSNLYAQNKSQRQQQSRSWGCEGPRRARVVACSAAPEQSPRSYLECCLMVKNPNWLLRCWSGRVLRSSQFSAC